MAHDIQLIHCIVEQLPGELVLPPDYYLDIRTSNGMVLRHHSDIMILFMMIRPTDLWLHNQLDGHTYCLELAAPDFMDRLQAICSQAITAHQTGWHAWCQRG